MFVLFVESIFKQVEKEKIQLFVLKNAGGDGKMNIEVKGNPKCLNCRGVLKNSKYFCSKKCRKEFMIKLDIFERKLEKIKIK